MYDEVNQVASANASKSAAMSDCAVVIIDMLLAKRGMLALSTFIRNSAVPCVNRRRPITTVIAVPLVTETGDSVLSSDSGRAMRGVCSDGDAARCCSAVMAGS